MLAIEYPSDGELAEVHIRLFDLELGEFELTVTVPRDSSLHAMIAADSPEAVVKRLADGVFDGQRVDDRGGGRWCGRPS